MKKQIFLFLAFIISFHAFSQITFEKGYYVNNSGLKIECFIKNIDWKNNPTDFEFKLTENSDSGRINIKSVKEFGIYNFSKFVRETVEIDRSSEDVNNLGYNRTPEFVTEQLFLKVLIEGKANLYIFDDGKSYKYFYNVENSDIEQLVHKKYKITETKIVTNTQFKQQLWNSLKCSSIEINEIDKIDYRRNDLVDLFVEYNECNSSNFINHEENQKTDLFNVTLRPGLKSASASLKNDLFTTGTSKDFNSDTEIGIRFGVEAEIILSFNKNKWAIIIEPTFQSFKSTKVLSSNEVTVDYKSIELPLGLRHYFFLNNDSKIFINSSFVFDFSSNSKIDYNTGSDLNIKTRSNLVFGIGYKYNDKYSVELRAQTGRELLSDYIYWKSEYKSVSLIFGYTIF